MVLPAYPPMEKTKNQLARARIQRQIRRKTNEAVRIRQKILMLQKELNDNNTIVTNLRMLLYRGAMKNTGIFCEVWRLMERFRRTEHLVPCSSFCASGIVCLSSCAALLDLSKPTEVIKLTCGSATTQKLDETPATYFPSVASLSISMQVCIETIRPESLRYFNSSTQDSDDTASLLVVEDEDRKECGEQKSIGDTFALPVLAHEVSKNTIGSTPTRSQWPFPATSPMDRSSPRFSVGAPQPSMDISAMDLGLSTSGTRTQDRIPSYRNYRINQIGKPKIRRHSRFLKRRRRMFVDDDYPSAATDDSSNLRAKYQRRTTVDPDSSKCVEVQVIGESQELENEYFRAIEGNDVAKVKSLLDLGITVECRNAQSNTGLIVAATNGFYDIVSCILSAGAAGHVNLSNDDGFTALQYASKLGDLDTVQCLLNYRADVDAKNKFHQTPIMLAARNGHSEVTGILLGAGASIERKDKGGRNALMMAARNGHVTVIEVLLKANACVNIVDRRGKTALTLMAEHACSRSIRGIELLLDYGAHARADDDDGLCALNYLGRRVKQGFLPLDSVVRSIAERMKRSMQ